MSKQNKTTAANRGKIVIDSDTKDLISAIRQQTGMTEREVISEAICNAATLARVSRWREHVVKHLAASAAHGAEIPAAWFEEIEGRPMVDVVMDWLCKDRGIGVTNRNPEQQCNFEVDEDYERTATRTRNQHEKEAAYSAIMTHLAAPLHHTMPNDDTMHELIRHFYHAGDCGIDAAIFRAVKFALNASQDAKAVA